MGGTSTDVALLQGGACRMASEAVVHGYPIKAPMLDIHTVGAGGGSIGWCDAGGVLRVGPRSAGALPGPAAYARGGVEPTVTDAHVVLGHLPPDGVLAGGVRLDRELARQKVVAAITFGNSYDVASRTELSDIFFQDDFHEMTPV